jgi:hypothetical protein
MGLTPESASMMVKGIGSCSKVNFWTAHTLKKSKKGFILYLKNLPFQNYGINIIVQPSAGTKYYFQSKLKRFRYYSKPSGKSNKSLVELPFLCLGRYRR